jgi:hypothetical protein
MVRSSCVNHQYEFFRCFVPIGVPLFLLEGRMNIVSLLISLVSGAIGGNVAGAAMKDKSLGTAGNSISGILGGGIGGAILQLLGIGGGTAGSLDIPAILENIASGGVGGGILLAIVAAIKGAMGKKS